jgi:hypothetical protein
MRVFLSALCLVVTGSLLAAQEPLPTSGLTARAATYVARFAGRISGVVVEETYVQDLPQVARLGYRTSLPRGPIHRDLKSDLLLVRPAGVEAWMQFRDVFEVDGKKVRDRNDRLTKLFLEPSKTNSSQAERIVKESARYNIGDIERTINLPFFGITILDRTVQRGFSFRIDTDGTADGPALPKKPDFTPPPGTVVLAYQETSMQTLVRTPQGRNLPSHGRFWVRPEDGAVLMTQLVVEDYTLSAVIHVAYRMNDDIGFPMPVAMHELYTNRTNQSRVEGLATYSNIREFSVKVDEDIAPVK